MRNKFKILFLFLIFFSINSVWSENLVNPRVFVAGDSLVDLKELFAQLQPVNSEIIIKDVKLSKVGVLDKHIQKFEDKLVSAWSLLDSNKKFFKLSSILSIFVYSKYINPEFLQNLITRTATTGMKYLSLFLDALFKGALGGVLENKGMTGKIVGGLILYSVVNNVMSIGIKSLSEYFVSGSKKMAENLMDQRYPVTKNKVELLH